LPAVSAPHIVRSLGRFSLVIAGGLKSQIFMPFPREHRRRPGNRVATELQISGAVPRDLDI
jgi:hypothetical protein